MNAALAAHPVALELLARAKTGEGVKSGPIGLAVILVLCIAAYFLFKSMSKHMRKVREGFPVDEDQKAAPGTSPDPEPTPDPEPPAGTEPRAVEREQQ